MNSRRNIFALIVAVAVPVGLLLFVPKTLDYLNLSRKASHTIRIPQKMFAEGTRQIVNRRNEKVIDTIYHTVPNYKFATQSGDSLALDSLRGSIYVANFFFATCPGICPKLSNSMEKVQASFIKDESLKLLSFTVDPEKDTMKALRKYADDHDAIPGKWYFLRGSQQDIAHLAAKGLYVTAKPDEDGGPETFVHSEKLVLVDWDGNIRGYYSGIDTASVSKLMGDIVLLLRASEQGFSFRKQKETTKGLLQN
jgi:protein SCO1/2